ncbi:MAG: hypothetical protein OCD76_00305 [Reichenbachiella sp.]
MKTFLTNPKNLFIIFLMLINAFTLTMLIRSHSKSHPSSRHNKEAHRDQFIINKIGFDEQQAKEFKILKKQHFEEVKLLKKTQRQMRKHLLSDLSDNTFNIDSLADKMALNQALMDKSAYYHFRELRTICRPEQLENFDSVMEKIMKRMHNDGPSKRNNGNKKRD